MAMRQPGQATTEHPERRGHWKHTRWRAVLIPVVIIAATFAAVALLGLNGKGGVDREQVTEKVANLLVGIPQHGPTLGPPRAPITLEMYLDMECPTVKRFAESYLPSLVTNWVRHGDVQLVYRPLQTDTTDEHMFFEQEVAALAAGRQNRTWHYVLTSVYEQQSNTNYATDSFLADIASQIPGLQKPQWTRDREDPLLSKEVALSVQHGRALHATPSFAVSFTSNAASENSTNLALKGELEATLQSELGTMEKEEGLPDAPVLIGTQP
jgi:hypothetical protein